MHTCINAHMHAYIMQRVHFTVALSPMEKQNNIEYINKCVI